MRQYLVMDKQKQPKQWRKLWRWLLKPEGIGSVMVGFWAIGSGMATAYLPTARLLEKQIQSNFFKLARCDRPTGGSSDPGDR
jgi:hypothetical protein